MNNFTCLRAARRIATPLALVVLSVAVFGCAEMPAEEPAPPPPVATPEPSPPPVQVAEPTPAPAPAVAEPAPKPEPVVNTGAKANYVGYTGIPWSRDFGVVGGRCDSAAAAKALGMQDGPRSVALAVAGSGDAKLIDAMDDRDRACMGHALELVRKGSAAAWSNSETGRAYRVTMGHDYVHEGLPCREFSAAVTVRGSAQETIKGGACRRSEARWELHQKG